MLCAFGALGPGGLYVIEDCSRRTAERLVGFLEKWPHPWAAIAMIDSRRTSLRDNTVVCIRRSADLEG